MTDQALNRSSFWMEIRGGIPVSVAVLMLLFSLRMFFIPASGSDDPDFYWHIAYGQWILENRAIPANDFFSWSLVGQPYQLTQWLGEAIMGAAYNWNGLAGTAFLSAILLVIFMWFAYQGAKLFVHPLIATAIVSMSSISIVLIPMRPHMFTFACLSFATWICIKYWVIETNRDRTAIVSIRDRLHSPLVFYPILMALWVNLHGGFITGLMLLGLLCLGMTAEAYIRANNRPWEAMRNNVVKETWLLWLILLLSFATTLMNPYGLGAWTAASSIASLKSSSLISEWQAVNLTGKMGGFYLLIAVPFVSAFVLAKGKLPLTHVLIGMAFVVFGLLANRYVMVAAAVITPFTASALSRTENCREIEAGLTIHRSHWYIFLFAILMMTWFFTSFRYDEDRLAKTSQAAFDAHGWEGKSGFAARHPVQAVKYIKSNKLGARVMSDTVEASWMIRQGIPVFIDGRMDYYGDDFFFAWRNTLEGKASWKHLLEQYRPTALLLQNDSALRQLALASKEWMLAFQDGKFSVLIPAHGDQT